MKGKVGLLVVVMALVGVLLAGCAPAAPLPTPVPQAGGVTQPTPQVSTRLEKVRLQNAGMSGAYQYYVLARAKGIFKEEGIDLEQFIMKSALLVPALLGGDVDFSTVVSSAVTAALMGVPVKAVMAANTKVDFFIITRPEINTAQGLKGKTIAIGSIGDASDIAVRGTLKALGQNPEEVMLVNIPSEQRLSAMKSGSVAAMSVKGNVAHMAIAQGFRELAFTGDYVDLISNGLSTSDSRIKGNPDQIRRMIRATIKAMAYYRDQKEETVQFIMKEFEMDRKTAEETREDQLKIASFDGSFSETGLQALVDQSRGQIKGPVSLEKLVDLTALRQAQKELGLSIQPDIKLK